MDTRDRMTTWPSLARNGGPGGFPPALPWRSVHPTESSARRGTVGWSLGPAMAECWFWSWSMRWSIRWLIQCDLGWLIKVVYPKFIPWVFRVNHRWRGFQWPLTVLSTQCLGLSYRSNFSRLTDVTKSALQGFTTESPMKVPCKSHESPMKVPKSLSSD